MSVNHERLMIMSLGTIIVINAKCLPVGIVESLLDIWDSHVIQNRDSMCICLTDADKTVTRITSD